ncbi:MAG: acyl-phosphate glycerol 3-phosphate acyltransferase [Acidobacteria bacterium]|nr:MAG: acyl-phosphate glycerol 3-phosphate acyltransferase [Acidobacteriota bacterium]
MTNCTVRASFVIRNSSFVIFNMGTAPKPAKVGWLGHSGVPASPGEVRSPQGPTNSIEEQTLAIIRELLSELGSDRAAQTISLHSSFERDLGLESLARVELLLRCEMRFNVRLPDEIAQRAETPAEWVQALGNGNAAASRAVEARYRIRQPAREAPRAPESARDWAQVLRHHAEVEPDRAQIHLLEGDSGEDITYGRLLATASTVAAGLVARGLERDETVAIMLPTSADFFYAFFGVMLAGGIAVPIYPPARPDKIEEYVRRQVGILRNAQVRFLIGFDEVKGITRIMRPNIPSLVDMTTVEALRQEGAAASGGRLATRGPSDTAFIQYTSGSTGDPKGVVLSQANVLANVRGIGWAVQFRPTDVVVSWLPLYHDMGLIGSWLFSVYFGAPITIFSPLAFLGRPERWLWALHDSGGTLCPAPNFAFELSARKIPDRALEGLDLSRWRVAINAGEAVLPETLARFAERFAPYGFRPESYVPCYGLAESSVALTFPPINRRPVIDVIRRDLFEAERRAAPAAPGETDVLRFVASGTPLPDHEVRIVDEQGREVAERAQGRLLFRGPSKTSGYYRDPEATAAVVTEDGWMDSGDLAYSAGGELYITGRVKDIIIKSGRNIIPQEVEAAAADVPGVRRGCVAAFGTVDRGTGTERLVVVAETRATGAEERRRIEAGITKSIDAVLGTPPNNVVLAGPHSIPKTSSGKIRRNRTRLLYESGKLEAPERPPWLQIARLVLENLKSWAGLTLRRLSAAAHSAWSSAFLFAAAVPAGLVARLAPGSETPARVIQGASRLVLSLSGRQAALEGADRLARGAPAVLVANRAGRFDPLVLAATLPRTVSLADPALLSPLPRAVAFLLKPLVLDPVYGEVAPPGGTLRQRIRHALEDGRSVLVFPDGPPGVPAHLSRFRLDAIHAALETSTPIYPIGIRNGRQALEGSRNSGLESRNSKLETGNSKTETRNSASAQAVSWNNASVRIAGPLSVDGQGISQREVVGLRDRIRRQIAEMTTMNDER